MATETLSAIDFTGTRYLKACVAMKWDPLRIPGRKGHTPSEIERTWKQAIRDERRSAPMPDGPSHTWSLLREFRLLAKQALQVAARYDLEIERLAGERYALLQALGE